jgi:hypothetical protein
MMVVGVGVVMEVEFVVWKEVVNLLHKEESVLLFQQQWMEFYPSARRQSNLPFR